MTLGQWITRHPEKEIEVSRDEWMLKGIPVEKDERYKYLDYEIIEAAPKTILTMEGDKFKLVKSEKVYEIRLGKKKGYEIKI